MINHSLFSIRFTTALLAVFLCLGCTKRLPNGPITSDVPPPSTLNEPVAAQFSLYSGKYGGAVFAVSETGVVKAFGVNSDFLQPSNGDAVCNPVLTIPFSSGVKSIAQSSGESNWGCAILADDSLVCWGTNPYDNVANGTTTPGLTPQPVNPGIGRTVKSVAVGKLFTCAILDDGSVSCWGKNLSGQLGTGNMIDASVPLPVSLPPGRKAKSVFASEQSNACAILEDDSLACWGNNAWGTVGAGYLNTASPYGISIPQLVDFGPGMTVKSVALGALYACAILNDNSVKCWGDDSYGQLGILLTGAETDSKFPSPQSVNLGVGRTAKSIAVGYENTCAVLDNDSLKCWGRNDKGQLGLGLGPNSVGSSAPVNLGTGRTVKSFAMGAYHSCAILDDSSLKCWGKNAYGQLGIGTTTDATSPQTVDLSGKSVKSVIVGGTLTCATLDDGTVQCWGAEGCGRGLALTLEDFLVLTPQTVPLTFP